MLHGYACVIEVGEKNCNIEEPCYSMFYIPLYFNKMKFCTGICSVQVCFIRLYVLTLFIGQFHVELGQKSSCKRTLGRSLSFGKKCYYVARIKFYLCFWTCAFLFVFCPLFQLSLKHTQTCVLCLYVLFYICVKMYFVNFEEFCALMTFVMNICFQPWCYSLWLTGLNAPTNYLFLKHTHTHIHTHTHTHTRTRTHTHFLSLSPSLSHTHIHTNTHTHFLSLSPSLSLTHTHKHIHTHSSSHTFMRKNKSVQCGTVIHLLTHAPTIVHEKFNSSFYFQTNPANLSPKI